jgi:Fe-S-cluster-containing dehydrogenase component
VLACPFGVPKMNTEYKLMMKCDMCYDRTSVGKKPMCATVCPSEALFFGTREQIEARRARSVATNQFRFGNQTITTKVHIMLPKTARAEYVDVTSAMNERNVGKDITFTVLTDALFDGEEEIV